MKPLTTQDQPILRFPPIVQAVAIGFALAATVPLAASDEDWPGFRGPTGMGVTTAKDLPLEWGGPEEKNILWKAPLPATADPGAEADHNQSSPVVRDGKVFVTTAHWSANQNESALAPEHHVTCYDAETGKQLWDAKVAAGPWMLTDRRGGYAAPTPAVADGRVFALFGSAILHALDVDEGKPLWSYTVAEHEKFDVALPTSPVVYEDTVILLLERKKPAATLVALDAATGKVRWEKKRPETSFGHMTPVLAEVDGKDQLLVTATDALQGIDPGNGEILWSCQWGRSIWPVSSPVVAEGGLVYAIGGRGGHPGLVVDPAGAAGDVTDSPQHLKWKIGPAPEGLGSPVAFGGLIYRLNKPDILRCVRIATGEELFKVRLEGATPAVSPFVTPEGRIYFASAGKTIVIEAGIPELKILATNDLGDPSMASAAVADGRIYLKGKKYLWAIGR